MRQRGVVKPGKHKEWRDMDIFDDIEFLINRFKHDHARPIGYKRIVRECFKCGKKQRHNLGKDCKIELPNTYRVHLNREDWTGYFQARQAEAKTRLAQLLLRKITTSNKYTVAGVVTVHVGLDESLQPGDIQAEGLFEKVQYVSSSSQYSEETYENSREEAKRCAEHGAGVPTVIADTWEMRGNKHKQTLSDLATAPMVAKTVDVRKGSSPQGASPEITPALAMETPAMPNRHACLMSERGPIFAEISSGSTLGRDTGVTTRADVPLSADEYPYVSCLHGTFRREIYGWTFESTGKNGTEVLFPDGSSRFLKRGESCVLKNGCRMVFAEGEPMVFYVK